jgi:formylglycine-generating enzyme required for sulfatase activity
MGIACRARSRSKCCFADDKERLTDYAWYGPNWGRQTYPVGRKRPHEWQPCYVHGNVREWVREWSGHYSEEAQEPSEWPGVCLR